MSTAACGLGFLHLFTWIKDGILNQSKGEGMGAEGVGGGFTQQDYVILGCTGKPLSFRDLSGSDV